MSNARELVRWLQPPVFEPGDRDTSAFAVFSGVAQFLLCEALFAPETLHHMTKSFQ